MPTDAEERGRVIPASHNPGGAESAGPAQIEPLDIHLVQILHAEVVAVKEPLVGDKGGVHVGGHDDVEVLAFAFFAIVVDGGFVAANLGRDSFDLDDIDALFHVGDGLATATRADLHGHHFSSGLHIASKAAFRTEDPRSHCRCVSAEVD